MRACAVACLAAGCGEPDVAVYDVPKDAGTPPAARAAPALDGAAPEAGGGLAWTAPAGWIAKSASAMRLATFEIPGADGPVELSVVALPGAAGGALANVNRWRGQLKLPPLAEGELAAHSEALACPAGTLRLVSFDGRGETGPAAVLGALMEHGGRSWFFKATGTPAAVRAARPAVTVFLKGLHAAR